MADLTSAWGRGPWAQGTNLGGQLWKKMMEQAMNIFSGKISPTELPEADRFKQDLMNAMKMMIGETTRAAQARGVEGGALGQMFERGKEQTAKGLGTYLQNIYTQSGQKAAGMAESAMNMRKFMNQLMTGYQMQKNQISSQEDIAKMQMITNSIMNGIGMLAKGLTGGLMGMGGGAANQTNQGFMTGYPSL